MILTMTPRTLYVGRSARNGGAASEVVSQAYGIVSGGIRVVIMGDSSLVQRDRTLVSGDNSCESSHFTTKISNNNRFRFYQYEAATDQIKPRRGDDHPSEDGGRDGGLLSVQRWC